MNWVIDKILKQLEDTIPDKDIQYYYFGSPSGLSTDQLIKGVISVEPKDTSVDAITTGIIDEDTFNLTIVISKLLRTLPNNAQKETGAQFMTRVVEGRDSNNNLNTNSIRYILRKGTRDYGIRQPNFTIAYDTDEVKNEGVVTATISLTVEGQTVQAIN